MTSANGSPLIVGLNGTMIPLDSCTLQTCSLKYGEVQYDPSFAANVAYMAFFAVLLIVHLSLGIFYRTWGFLVGMFCGLGLEVGGYGARIGLHNNPFDFNTFVVNLVCLTIGPAFLSASIYLSLSRLIIIYGAHIAPFAPKTYTYVFISCDFISLVLQATGGALAASADTKSAQNTGVNVMIAGLVFQVASIGLFMSLSLNFFLRVKRTQSENNNPHFEREKAKSHFTLFPLALAFAIIAIFIRCVYRVAELHGGFGGKLANNQATFLIFEGPMIMLAGLALALFHPGICLSGVSNAADWNKDASTTQKSQADHLNVGSLDTTPVNQNKI